jgi:hypothetical protein
MESRFAFLLHTKIRGGADNADTMEQIRRGDREDSWYITKPRRILCVSHFGANHTLECMSR